MTSPMQFRLVYISASDLLRPEVAAGKEGPPFMDCLICRSHQLTFCVLVAVLQFGLVHISAGDSSGQK